jgi:hypothetical protein
MKKKNIIIWISLSVVSILLVLLGISTLSQVQEIWYKKYPNSNISKSQKRNSLYCSDFSAKEDRVPLTQHIYFKYQVSDDFCYKKEPELAQNTNTISIQRLEKNGHISPLNRLINLNSYQEELWQNSFDETPGIQKANIDEVVYLDTQIKDHIPKNRIYKRMDSSLGFEYTTYYFPVDGSFVSVTNYGNHFVPDYQSGDVTLTWKD